jgi:hypothetical protein
MNPEVVARKPIGPLASYVEMLWYCEGYPSVHRFVPTSGLAKARPQCDITRLIGGS